MRRNPRAENVRFIIDLNIVDIDKDDPGFRRDGTDSCRAVPVPAGRPSGTAAEKPGIGQDAVFVREPHQRPPAQGFTGTPEGDQIFVEPDKLFVLVSPWISPAVVGIRKSRQPRFIPVIDGRSPGPCHLNEHCLAHDLHVSALKGCRTAQALDSPHDAVGARQEPGMVMVGELVHADPQRRFRQGIPVHSSRFSPERCGITVEVLSPGIAVFFHPGEKTCQWFHEKLVVHDGVPLFSLQPFLGIRIVFRQNDSLRIGLLHSLPEAFPELMVKGGGIAEVRGDIQPPAVRAIGRRDPFFPDPYDLPAEFLGTIIVQFRKRLEFPPCVIGIVGRPFTVGKAEILRIGRPSRRLGSPDPVREFLIDLLRVHPAVERAAVIEHSVQDDADPSRVGFPDQLCKEPVARFEIGRIRYPDQVALRILIGQFFS